MKQKMPTLISLTLILLLLGCTSTPTNPATPGQPSPSPSSTPSAGATMSPPAGTNTPAAGTTDTPAVTDPGFNILVVAEGEIELKRSTWADYHATTFGTVLERGDLLKLARGAEAAILCDGLSLWQVPTGIPVGLSTGCPPPSDKILVRGSAGVAGTIRGANDPLIPYIISPRSTRLLNSTPTLRWNDSGATGYNVQVRGGDLNWQQTDVPQTELIYPGEPPLEPGVFYLGTQKNTPLSKQFL